MQIEISEELVARLVEEKLRGQVAPTAEDGLLADVELLEKRKTLLERDLEQEKIGAEGLRADLTSLQRQNSALLTQNAAMLSQMASARTIAMNVDPEDTATRLGHAIVNALRVQ